MIKPVLLWNLCKKWGDSKALGDALRSIGGQEVKLDDAASFLKALILQDNEWDDEQRMEEDEILGEDISDDDFYEGDFNGETKAHRLKRLARNRMRRFRRKKAIAKHKSSPNVRGDNRGSENETVAFQRQLKQPPKDKGELVQVNGDERGILMRETRFGVPIPNEEDIEYHIKRFSTINKQYDPWIVENVKNYILSQNAAATSARELYQFKNLSTRIFRCLGTAEKMYRVQKESEVTKARNDDLHEQDLRIARGLMREPDDE